MNTIGIDIGGTKILGVVFNSESKKVLRRIKIKTDLHKNKFIKQIEDIISELIESSENKNNPEKIGICLPGILDRKRKIILRMPNITEVRNFKIGSFVKSKFKADVRIENDAKCFAIAEHLYGYGKGKKNFIVLALGTGLGGGIFIDGKVYLGNGNAGELGHINIFPDGYKCSCGNRGCLEEYASGKAIERYSKELNFKTNDPKEIEILARVKKDKKALGIYERLGKNLGIGISSLIKILDPETVIITGSIANASDLFIEFTKKESDKRVFFKHAGIKVSKIKDGAAIGAASLFRLKENESYI